MLKLTKTLISNDVPSKISFTRKSALHLPTAPCTFQNLAGTLCLPLQKHKSYSIFIVFIACISIYETSLIMTLLI